jgi:preprotein translocase subunit SecA
MHLGKLAQMQTGEGKTLAAVFPVYLNALSGRGVHVLTFNDYLARRDAKWMGPVYNFLGLTAGYVQEGMSLADRRKAYNSDITYLTAKESGFDYLRDNLCYDRKNIVHRLFNYAVIDEADSILIDEARVPLIIAGASDDYAAKTYNIARIVRKLEEKTDFEYDEYVRNIYLTEKGLKKVENILNCNDLYAEENIETLARLNYALHAEYLLHIDKDYIVRSGKVELVDEFTGRVADRRRWPDGLQAAIEAKEHLTVQSNGRILNSITLQNFVKLYPKIGGMTATAEPAEDEFREFYDLHIVVIPPNKPCVRVDHKDTICKTKEEKQDALINEILRVHKTKRPVLVGTRSVKESSILAVELWKLGVKCEVLNAKNDEFEAKIIARAGKLGAVTISTNMAGRGTDIRLGAENENEKEQVSSLGGLYIIGTNRHESRRIDDQLRGRAGRQGDPGSARFIISLEDDLFVKYRLKDLISSRYIFDLKRNDVGNAVVKKEIDRIQRIIEGQNLEIKKTLNKYSLLIDRQRKTLYQRRGDILTGDSVLDFYRTNAAGKFDHLLKKIGIQRLLQICRKVSLIYIDKFWSQYLAEIDSIREGIHFNRIGGQDPLFVFHQKSIEIFDKLEKHMETDMIRSFNKISIKSNIVDMNDAGLKVPSATWTYLINDDPFNNLLGIQFIGTIAFSIGAGLLWPLIAVYSLFQKMRRQNRKTKAHNS